MISRGLPCGVHLDRRHGADSAGALQDQDLDDEAAGYLGFDGSSTNQHPVTQRLCAQAGFVLPDPIRKCQRVGACAKFCLPDTFEPPTTNTAPHAARRGEVQGA